MRIHLCGVRGSTPSPGAEFARFGGHTSCVAIAHDGGTAPVLVLDAGTGLRRVSGLLEGDAFRGTILLTHLHWDHVQGLPFFAAGDRPDADVRMLMPVDGDDGLEPVDVLARGMSPPHFPITPRELRGRWSFEAIKPGVHEFEGFVVTVAEVPHKGGPTVGYRVDDGRQAVVYVPDHGPPSPEELDAAVVELARGADLLLHDAQHTAEEWPGRFHFGHSSAEYAVATGLAAGVGEVVLFHHDPGRTDAELDRLLDRFQDAPVAVRVAVEGSVLDRT
ncbi:MAG: metal-dependent hydrolase, beta-lactamase superfamily [Acidimicrobiales bacterium]|jgi:phosphoribosyl 1,2-cyclic phosphodiesterase|nr:metal-dependent hydrolase, beta-lactamase superfamily [Acidimicrobiales bacterium]